MEKSRAVHVPYEGKLLRLEVHRVELGGGGEAVREVVRHPGAVVVLPLSADGKVVMVRQFRFAVGEELLELPAGTLRPGEDPGECAARELAEETGLRGELVPLGCFYSAPGFCDEKLYAFLAQGLESGPAHPDEDEELAMVTLSREEMASAVARGVIRDAKTLACLALACTRGVFPVAPGGNGVSPQR